MNLFLLFVHSLLFTTTLVSANSSSQWIDYPANGFASMTHYTLPLNFVASCGCVPGSTHYPTAALSQMAYGSSTAYGPSCGRCFKLTLLNTFLSNPPFFPDEAKSVVVKVTDLCPIAGQWCSATQTKPNPSGNFLNFDLAWPSQSIPNDFFPSNVTLYGYTDFGVWNISYESVSCESSWAGAKDSSAQGAVSNLGTSVCCPSDPFTNPNTTCGSFSDDHGIPPTAAPGASRAFTVHISMLSLFFAFFIIAVFSFIQ